MGRPVRPHYLVDALVRRAAEVVIDSLRGDENYRLGQASGFFYAAEQAAGWPEGWPKFADWRDWLLAAVKETPNPKGVTCANCGAVNHYPFGVGDACRLCGATAAGTRAA